MNDGAHTHHHGPAGSVLAAALVLAAAIIAAAHILAAILPALLIGLGVLAALGIAGLIAYAVTAHRRQQQLTYLPRTEETTWPGDREVVTLRQAITELHAQLAAARTARPAVHQHVHFHGLDPPQIAAILASQQRQEGGEPW